MSFFQNKGVKFKYLKNLFLSNLPYVGSFLDIPNSHFRNLLQCHRDNSVLVIFLPTWYAYNTYRNKNFDAFSKFLLCKFSEIIKLVKLWQISIHRIITGIIQFAESWKIWLNEFPLIRWCGRKNQLQKERRSQEQFIFEKDSKGPRLVEVDIFF